MDLKLFIKETLVQISQGIEDANQALEGTTTIVNPRHVAGVNGTNDAKVYGYVAEDKKLRQAVQSINFDVAISVVQGTEIKGGCWVGCRPGCTREQGKE
ncbi:MAG: hypothetical protein PF689_03055 [Deltaproteobacteria bacterium]|nr:hypothetical protein [Deltaproteobacteria bacterium]